MASIATQRTNSGMAGVLREYEPYVTRMPARATARRTWLPWRSGRRGGDVFHLKLKRY